MHADANACDSETASTDGTGRNAGTDTDTDTDTDTETVIAAMLALANSRQPHLHAWIGVDLSMAQLRALLVIAHQQQMERPLAVREVADHLGVTLSTASHLIERLVRADMVTRHGDPGDRRRTLLQPTATATALLHSLRADSAAHMRHWLQHLDPPDLAALATGMRALQVVVEQHTHTNTATNTSMHVLNGSHAVAASSPSTSTTATASAAPEDA